MTETFTIRLTGKINGEEIHPDTFDLADMLRFLDGVLKGVNSEARRESVSSKSSARLLSLLAITDKCTEMLIAYTSTATPAVNRISTALCSEDLDGLSAKTQEVIRKTFGYMTNKGAGIQFANGKLSPVYSDVHPLPQPKKETFLVEDSASLLARVFKIGGKSDAKIYATFEATNQTIPVDCSMAIAKRMADSKCLYEIISLVGKAEWRVNPWSIAKFTVSDFTQHFKGKASKLFKSIDKELVNSFRNVDVDKFMKDVRGEDEQ